MLPVSLVDLKTSISAKVTSLGQVVTAPFDYDESSTVELAVAGTIYNFFAGRPGFNFIITTILIYANRNVGVNDATVQIYESVSAASGTSLKEILTTEVLKQSARDLLPLNLKVTEGNFINAETDDDDVFVTIMGYYAPVPED